METHDECLFEYGLERVILGTIAIEHPEIVKELAKKNPGRIVVGIDAKHGKVATRGWLKQSEVQATTLAKNFHGTGIAAIIATDIETDGTLKGPNIQEMKSMALASSVPIIASGGVGSIEDLLSLLALESYGVTGVIVGRALYDGTIDFREACKAIGDGYLQDPIQEDNYIA